MGPVGAPWRERREERGYPSLVPACLPITRGRGAGKGAAKGAKRGPGELLEEEEGEGARYHSRSISSSSLTRPVGIIDKLWSC